MNQAERETRRGHSSIGQKLNDKALRVLRGT